MRRGLLVVAMLLASTRSGLADSPVAEPAETAARDVATPDPPRTLTRTRRALAIAAAVVPGLVLRGAGSWVAGEKRAAVTLAGAAAGGLVLLGGGAGFVGGSNGHPYSMPAVPFVIAGGGAILTSWVEDIWIAAGGSAVDAAPRVRPLYSLEVGEVWQHDAYRERLYQRVAASIDVGRFGASAAGLLSFTGDAWLVFADARVRVLGDDACTWCVRVRAGGRVQRDRDDRVTQLVGEVEVLGRLGLARFDRAMRATFVELSTGLGVNRVTYAEMASEVDNLLLGRFAWGAYVPGGEITAFYDHRRDGLVGGIDAWRAAGFIGSFGASADIRVDGPWALRGEFQVGNSYLTTLAIAYRGDR